MRTSLTIAGSLILILLFCLPAAAAAGQTGAISMISSPQPADVYVNDTYVGQTDNAFVNISEGYHTVRVVKAGYHEYIVDNVYVPGGPAANTVPMSANLQKSEALAGLVVDSSPSGASVYVDDIYKGTTHYGGLQIADLASGLHTIRLEMDGYKPYTVTDYNTPSGYATYLTNVRLIPVATATPTPAVTGSPATASILLESTPSGTSVSLNNEFRGYTPLTVTELTPGSYHVLVSRDGYMAWQTTVTVAAGDVLRQTAVLNPDQPAPPAPTRATGFGVPLLIAGLGAAGLMLFRRS